MLFIFIVVDEGFWEIIWSSGEEIELFLKVLKVLKNLILKVWNVFLKFFWDKEEKEEKEEKEDKEDDEVIVYDRFVREIELDSIFRCFLKEIEFENFFKWISFFKDKDEDDKGVWSEELFNLEGFFCRFF